MVRRHLAAAAARVFAAMQYFARDETVLMALAMCNYGLGLGKKKVSAIDLFLGNIILCSAISRVFADGLDSADTLLKRFLPRLGPRETSAAPSFARCECPAAIIYQLFAVLTAARSTLHQHGIDRHRVPIQVKSGSRRMVILC